MPKWEPGQEEYAFVRVEGDGVHEIPVGPVHAGIIEPGHFRFQIVGEKVLRLEQRLGFVHKGIEKRFESMPAATGHRLAGRVSGDSTVAYAWAYAQALEAIAETPPPPRALWLRALALERERIANHLGDLGYLGNDGGFAFGLAQFSRLKEDVLRGNLDAFGHRFAMDFVVPGGVARDVAPERVRAMRDECAMLEHEIRTLRDIYDEHEGLQDRFRTCGIVTPELAAKLGLTGLAGRASGQARDLRCDFPGAPYDALAVRMVSTDGGDVAARVAVRFDELLESLRLVRAIVDALPDGGIVAPLPEPPAFRKGLGYVEGWRGPVLVALECGPGGTIRRCHPHDPSWSNWPVLEHAVIGNIVPDFPLINKSFNLSYSGQDLCHAARPPPDRPDRHQDRGGSRAGPRHGRRHAAAGEDPDDARARADDPPGRRRLVQRLRARDPRARQSVLQHRGARHQVRRQPAPRRHAAGDRPGVEAHGDRAAAHLRRDAGAEARRRRRRLRLHRRHLRRELREPRPRRQRDPRRRRDSRLPADADGAAAGHSRRDHGRRPTRRKPARPGLRRRSAKRSLSPPRTATRPTDAPRAVAHAAAKNR